MQHIFSYIIAPSGIRFLYLPHVSTAAVIATMLFLSHKDTIITVCASLLLADLQAYRHFLESVVRDEKADSAVQRKVFYIMHRTCLECVARQMQNASYVVFMHNTKEALEFKMHGKSLKADGNWKITAKNTESFRILRVVLISLCMISEYYHF